ncbi:hypothetical protein PR048_015111 [Dryococelus australis]|uniref:Uncharacterized protein n=1 Tax=Dryococelus australis TaxID=614101 RepID=A0ABQ9HG98_9NEOP|nr:hypothetical protein PR048_015111 [Dryococelus australis]
MQTFLTHTKLKNYYVEKRHAHALGRGVNTHYKPKNYYVEKRHAHALGRGEEEEEKEEEEPHIGSILRIIFFPIDPSNQLLHFGHIVTDHLLFSVRLGSLTDYPGLRPPGVTSVWQVSATGFAAGGKASHSTTRRLDHMTSASQSCTTRAILLYMEGGQCRCFIVCAARHAAFALYQASALTFEYNLCWFLKMERCCAGRDLQEDCSVLNQAHPEYFTVRLSESDKDLLETRIKCLNVQCACLYDRCTFLSNFRIFLRVCCDPFTKHKKNVYKGPKTISFSFYKKYQVSIEPVPGKKLCISCRKFVIQEANTNKKEHENESNSSRMIDCSPIKVKKIKIDKRTAYLKNTAQCVHESFTAQASKALSIKNPICN